MLIRSFSLLVLCMVMYECHAKPAQKSLEPLHLSPVKEQVVPVIDAYKRDQRSPQFGFPEREFEGGHHHKHHLKREGCLEFPCREYPEYPERIPPALPLIPGAIPPPLPLVPGVIPAPLPLIPGAIPPPLPLVPGAAYPGPFVQPYREGGAGESSASASSGTINAGGFGGSQSQASAQSGNTFATGGGPFREGQSQANAESATFNFGPLSATFSKAESSSNNEDQQY